MYMYIWSTPPPPSPQWYGLAGRGVGGVSQRAGILRKPCAGHKPYNPGHVPGFVNLNLY